MRDHAMRGYRYAPWVYDELCALCRGLFPGLDFLFTSTAEDVGGVDVVAVINHYAKLAIRARFDRPDWAPDIDVTFRETEPAMIDAATYAPLALFVWFHGFRVQAARLIDVYHMAARIAPALRARPIHRFGDCAFVTVRIGELHDARALLRSSDGRAWITDAYDGDARLTRIVCPGRQAALRL